MDIKHPKTRFLPWLLLSILLVLTRLSVAFADDDRKLDDGLTGEGTFAILVRCEDQLFKKAGDYEAWAKEHTREKRSVLRAATVELLRKKSDASWEKLAASVQSLEKDGQLQNRLRYWIFNGFACQATAKAAAALAELPEVAFVYKQNSAIPPQYAVIIQPTENPEPLKKQLKEVAEAWRDDSQDPLDLKDVEIPWNLQMIQADKAWKEEHVYGRGVIVALSDTGIAMIPPLTRALWKNPKAQLSGKDSGHGYADDLFGWDFRADNNLCLGDGPGMPHGSICAGIIAGRVVDEKRFITGVAPRARLMMLRGMASLRSYEYAAINGADVLSMSYMFPGVPLGNYRGVFRLAHEQLAACGVVAVGGAGNFSQLPEGQQIALPKDIPCVIAAAGVTKDGAKGRVSSEGPCYWEGVRYYSDYPKDKPLKKPDVTGCFGGYPVWMPGSMEQEQPALFAAGPAGRHWNWDWTSKDKSFGLVTGPQGNSFSGPHAAGVAALMLSANPDLNPWEVKEIIEKTCKDLGGSGWDKRFGHGLLQAAEAVKAAKAVKK